jgi:hypothetical protein
MLTLLIKSPENKSSQSVPEVMNLLCHAKSKLRAEDIPLQMKAVSYVKLCCTAIRKLPNAVKMLKTECKHELVTDNLYSSLLSELCHLDPNWWMQCQISDRGILQSTDTEIDYLLQPLGFFVELFADDYSYPQSQRMAA